MTRLPSCAERFAATRPAMPAPITITSCWTVVLAIAPGPTVTAAPAMPSARQLTTPSRIATGSIYEAGRCARQIRREPVLMGAGFGLGADPDRQRGVRIPTGGFQDDGAARRALLGFSVFQLLLEFL